jgi:hypothetical protein
MPGLLGGDIFGIMMADMFLMFFPKYRWFVQNKQGNVENCTIKKNMVVGCCGYIKWL